MKFVAIGEHTPSWSFWVFLIFLLIVGLTGGASRFDVQSLLILRPLSVFACAVALVTLRRAAIDYRKRLIWGLGAIFAICLLHLVPVPAPLWQSFPGRQGLAATDNLAGLGALWRPLTLTPTNGLHAFASLFVPLAVLLLGLQLDREDLYRLLPVVIVLGALSGFLGIAQVIGSPNGPLYFYSNTNNGSAVGLFSNRNHAALFLAIMFPLLASWASLGAGNKAKTNRRFLAALGIGAVLLVLIFVTGSRSGLLLGLVGIATTPFIYGTKLDILRQRRLRWRVLGISALGVATIILFGMAMLHFSRAEALERLFANSPESDSRADFWKISLQLFWKYFPVGSGLGSFVETYQIVEPADQLSPYYLNHAHNDLIETGVTLGIPGLLLIFVAAVFYVRQTFFIWFRNDAKRRSVRIARMASVVLLMIAAASLFDYPLRTPIMMSVFVLMSLWLLENDQKSSARSPISKPEAEA